MKTYLKTLKADLHNVFVMGNADDRQLARIYFLLITPSLAAFFAIGHFPLY